MAATPNGVMDAPPPEKKDTTKKDTTKKP
jgi:hypothetical protein